jgi:hypothetical protein
MNPLVYIPIVLLCWFAAFVFIRNENIYRTRIWFTNATSLWLKLPTYKKMYWMIDKWTKRQWIAWIVFQDCLVQHTKTINEMMAQHEQRMKEIEGKG